MKYFHVKVHPRRIVTMLTSGWIFETIDGIPAGSELLTIDVDEDEGGLITLHLCHPDAKRFRTEGAETRGELVPKVKMYEVPPQ